MISPEGKIAVVTDSGCSMRPEYAEVQRLRVTILPLEIVFYEDGKLFPCLDLQIDADEFYRKMRPPNRLPTTSGSIVNHAVDTYRELSEKNIPIISIHLTSELSAVYSSAVTAAGIVTKDARNIPLEVIDSRQISLGLWFPVEHAAKLSQKGATLEQIKEEVLEMIPNIHLLAVLESLENLKRGGRATDVVKAIAAQLLSLHPVLELKDGKLKQSAMTRTHRRAIEKMIEMIEGNGKLLKMAVIHTNNPERAREVQRVLIKFYQGEIPICEAGSVLGVHAGEGAVAVAFQTV